MGLFDFLSEIDTGNLASDSRWSIIQAGIEIGISEGLSMTETASQLRVGGLAFSNDPYRELFRELSGYREAFNYQTRIGGDLYPNENLMAFSKYPIEASYGYVGQFWELNDMTGLLEPRTFRIDSDDLLTRNQALQQLEEYVSNRSPEVLDRMIGTVEFLGSMRTS